ncbi:SGNH/GDSL hydrolase family protein [Paenibacillus shunpengii]|uniref:SGNH/GDSL hydrolase family protein n=1 Tax=Paenibacillus shunpengii TaxID=2054424 RepID=A0ABW5SKZ4_9BACL
MTRIEDQATVLFIGDSITDCGRNYDNVGDLGRGYAMMVAAELNFRYPEKQIQFMNRGINGNRVTDLEQRWEQDCLAHNPTWVSIYIGINDTWRWYDSKAETSADEFYRTYRELLVRTKEHTNANIVIIEPFVLPVPEDRKGWRVDLDPKIHAIRELAREFGTYYVPLDGLFAQASTKAEPAYWAGDGVHPTDAGHALIARAWLDAVKV